MRKIVSAGLFLSFFGLFWNGPLAVSGEVSILIHQDETFFLKNELTKANALVAQRDLETQRLILEKEIMKNELVVVKEERDLLEKKVEGLQKTLVRRDQDFPGQMKKATDPFQEKIDELMREQEVLRMRIEQKNERVNEVSGEGIALQAEIDNAAREKTLLIVEFKKVRAELDALKADVNNRLLKERAIGEAKVKDLEARLTAEKTLMDAKIRRAQKPCEDKVLSLSQQIEAQDTAWRKKIVEAKVIADIRVKSLERLSKQVKGNAADKALISKAQKDRSELEQDVSSGWFKSEVNEWQKKLRITAPSFGLQQ
ncbi:MAG: hypothetical protein HQL21_08755 [Candidatus Omnitrophica bacterium]|nr:hypothetical protein [Candidatus Omnitrophota bacterium]